MAFDLDSAARALRDEPTPLPHPGPVRRGVRPFRWAAPAAAALAVFLLWPRTGSSAAWAQVAEASRKAIRTVVHSTRAGKPLSDRWQDGSDYAIDFYDAAGKLMYRSRMHDGKWMNYSRLHRSAWIYPVGERDVSASLLMGGDAVGLDELLKSDGVRELSPSKPEGDLVRYRLVWKLVARPGRTFERRFDALVEPKTRRIRRVEHYVDGKVGMIDEVDYPASIPAARFSLTAPDGVPVRDAERVIAKAKDTIRRGLAVRRVAGQTVTLRGLFADGGNLSILWTGSDLPSDGRFPARLDGAPIRVGYGIAVLSSNPDKDKTFRPAVYGGLPLRGQQYYAKGGARPRYTVRIPIVQKGKRVGEAVFPDVQVVEIPSIYSLEEAVRVPRNPKRKSP